jgi:hypothetical protein
LKLNYIGIIGAVIALVSSGLPWWILTSSIAEGDRVVLVYPYQATLSIMGQSLNLNENLWYGWVAFVLIIAGGVLGVVGSILRYGRKLLYAGTALATIAAAVFTIGLQRRLAEMAIGGLRVSLFSNASQGEIAYSSYLYYGYWLAFFAAIVMAVASMMQPAKGPPPQKEQAEIQPAPDNATP